MKTTTGVNSAGKQKLVFLAVLFVLPVVLAISLYIGGWRPSGTVNYGQLIQPPRPIADVNLQTLDGKTASFSELGQRKWSLIYFGSAECTERCERRLYIMRQVHLAQGKNFDRIQRLFVVTDPKALDLLRYVVKDHPGMIVVTGPGESVANLARQFSVPAGPAQAGQERIYLVDPLGNFMLQYPPDVDPSGMRKDLVRLLKVSQVG